MAHRKIHPDGAVFSALRCLRICDGEAHGSRVEAKQPIHEISLRHQDALKRMSQS